MQKEQFQIYQQQRRQHWDSVATLDLRFDLGRYYHQRLAEIYRFLIPPHQKVLELGCGKGDLLAALQPSHGVGVDFSEQMLLAAQKTIQSCPSFRPTRLLFRWTSSSIILSCLICSTMSGMSRPSWKT